MTSFRKIEKTLDELRNGRCILVYDDEKREGETDLVIASQFITPEVIRLFRKDGGGLIFLMVSYEIAKNLQLPFLSDLFLEVSSKYPVFKALIPHDIPYDTKSSFSVYVNHRRTFTGITDQDRSLTMKRFAEIAKEVHSLDSSSALKIFGNEFRSPGHVPICVASEHLLRERRGHTELVVSLLKMAGLTPVGSGCEMMGDNGRALPKDEAIGYAKRHGYSFIEGYEIIKAWESWLER
ncbi:MAG: 3,4-dihydroxy-2-butanone-4-phosphate synthase [Candidatus Thermoplasmatota archaeon]